MHLPTAQDVAFGKQQELQREKSVEGVPTGDSLGGAMRLHDGGDDSNGGQGHLLAAPCHAALHHQHQLLPPLQMQLFLPLILLFRTSDKLAAFQAEDEGSSPSFLLYFPTKNWPQQLGGHKECLPS